MAGEAAALDTAIDARRLARVARAAQALAPRYAGPATMCGSM
jgi:putative endonuclease